MPLAARDVWLDWVRTAIDLADETALTAASKPRPKPRTGKPGGGGGGGGI
jgi:hypothetical protein